MLNSDELLCACNNVKYKDYLNHVNVLKLNNLNYEEFCYNLNCANVCGKCFDGRDKKSKDNLIKLYENISVK